MNRVVAAWVILTVSAVASPSRACNTPVYRYAMYNWAPAPYEFFHFYRGKMTDADRAVQRNLEELSRKGPALANVLVTPIDISKPQQLDKAPPPVRESWKDQHKSAAPTWLVWTPWGAEVHAGALDAAAVKGLTESPARAKLCDLLHQGHATVLVLLPGSDAADAARAEKVAKEVIALAAAGKVKTAASGGEEMPAAMPGEEPAKPQDKKSIQVALLRIARDDPKEQWLVRMLLAVEPDLHTYGKEPMIFGFYGRGRAMEPFVGKGISTENLVELVGFLSGPCSCQVKDGNPGKDMLFHWNWQETADRLAASDESSDRLPAGMYEEFPAEGGRSEAAQGDGASPQTPASAGPGSPRSSGDSKVALRQQARSPDSPAALPLSDAHPASDRSTTEVGQASAEPSGFAARQMWRVAAVFGALAIVVLASGLVWIRRQAT